MSKALILIMLSASLFLSACAAPTPRTVDGSRREPVNKTIIKEQTGGRTNVK